MTDTPKDPMEAAARAAYQAACDCPDSTVEIVFARDAKPGNRMAAEAYRKAARAAFAALADNLPPHVVEKGVSAMIKENESFAYFFPKFMLRRAVEATLRATLLSLAGEGE